MLESGGESGGSVPVPGLGVTGEALEQSAGGACGFEYENARGRGLERVSSNYRAGRGPELVCSNHRAGIALGAEPVVKVGVVKVGGIGSRLLWGLELLGAAGFATLARQEYLELVGSEARLRCVLGRDLQLGLQI